MVKPKKHLGQHFLTDKSIAHQIVQALTQYQNYTKVIEIGAGTGILTDFILENSNLTLTIVEIDHESVVYLNQKYAKNLPKILETNFLKWDLKQNFQENIGVIGNFPYNISSQIFFHLLSYKDLVVEIVCMLQKEVAERLASAPNSRDYGILSVFLQAFYDIEYLFDVPPTVFNPPPKVQSGVIRLKRNSVNNLPCDEILFQKIVKQGFNNRRKTLRNSLKILNLNHKLEASFLLDKRAEQLSVQDFVLLTQLAED